MKKVFLLFSMLVFHLLGFAQNNEVSTGLPGDNFSLEGALELFKKSSSLEDFENKLNSEKSQVNNLDLDGNGDIDYVRVISKKDGDVHLIILQVPVSASENQDIAVIEIEKTSKNEAVLQIIGDEDIFGEEVIIEPSDGNDEEEEDGGQGPSFTSSMTFTVVNVWTWPVVSYMYAPSYRPYISPWRWSYYPSYWRPWRPLSWNAWRPIRVKYHSPLIRMVNTHRVVSAHKLYKPIRVTSTTVRTRHASAHASYKVNHTKTTVTGPRGNSATKTKTTVRGPKGQVRAQKTKVKKGKNG